MTENGMHTDPLGVGGPQTRTRSEQGRDQPHRRPAVGWHALPAQEVLDGLQSATQGLNATEATRRLGEVGPNSAQEGRRESLLEEVLESLREPLQLLLVVVGVPSAIWGELRDPMPSSPSSEPSRASRRRPSGGPVRPWTRCAR